MNLNLSKIETGNVAEKTAVKYLKKKGYKILETQYHCRPYGEIDIVAIHKKEKDLIFVEVKSYTKNSYCYGDPFEKVTQSKQQKIKITAQAFLKENKVKFNNIRFDVISIIGDKIEHIENAFT